MAEDAVSTDPGTGDEPGTVFLDALADASRLELFRALAAYRSTWWWQQHLRKSRRAALVAAARQVGAWLEHGRITRSCRDRMTRAQRYVEYWYLGVSLWARPRLPSGERP